MHADVKEKRQLNDSQCLERKIMTKRVTKTEGEISKQFLNT